MKEIWKQFMDTLKSSASASWEEIKKVLKSTFDVFKTAVIDFVKALGTWLWSLIEGVAVIVYNLIKVVGAGLLAALKSTVGLGVESLINFIKRW